MALTARCSFTTLIMSASQMCCRHSGQTSSTQKGSTAGTAAATATEELVHGGVAADALAAGSAQPQGLRNSAVRIPVSIQPRPSVSGHSCGNALCHCRH